MTLLWKKNKTKQNKKNGQKLRQLFVRKNIKFLLSAHFLRIDDLENVVTVSKRMFNIRQYAATEPSFVTFEKDCFMSEKKINI